MVRNSKLTAEMIANHFVGYVCEHKAASKHVRRVLAWVGFVIRGVEQIADEWGYHRTRQFWFRIDNKFYKVRYGHSIGARGGLQIVEMLGNADGDVVCDMPSMDAAEAFYNQPQFMMGLRACPRYSTARRKMLSTSVPMKTTA